MNIVELGLAFVEGLALIASPCILPILPLILATSVEGGRKRPFGIILGFIISFALFAMLSRQIVELFHLDLNYIKNGSLILLGLFGIILLSETLSEKFARYTAGLANIGNNISSNAKGGFFSGILIGALIGLVWTPCAGPILAAVLVQVIRQQSDLAGLFIITSFALGAAIPMLIIALTGRKILSKFGFFIRHADLVRKFFGVIILSAVAFIASGIDASGFFQSQDQENTKVKVATNKAPLAPEFAGIDSWLNTRPLTMESLRGKVVLIDFWTYSCINCVRTLPYLKSWDQKYAEKGLVIIGVHAPEFEFEKSEANVVSALMQYSIKYPIALDNNLDTWTAFKNKYWPAHYLIDQNGRIVYTHFGEGNYAETENNIRHLLGLGAMEDADKMPEPPVFSANQTPETYLGYSRAARYSNDELIKDVDSNYTLPKTIPVNNWALQGKWKVSKDKITARKTGSILRLNFVAGKVFLVLGNNKEKPVTAHITLNGQSLGKNAGEDVKNGIIEVKEHRLYELVNQHQVKNGVIEIRSDEPGLEVYAFTFGL